MPGSSGCRAAETIITWLINEYLLPKLQLQSGRVSPRQSGNAKRPQNYGEIHNNYPFNFQTVRRGRSSPPLLSLMIICPRFFNPVSLPRYLLRDSSNNPTFGPFLSHLPIKWWHQETTDCNLTQYCLLWNKEMTLMDCNCLPCTAQQHLEPQNGVLPKRVIDVL